MATFGFESDEDQDMPDAATSTNNLPPPMEQANTTASNGNIGKKRSYSEFAQQQAPPLSQHVQGAPPPPQSYYPPPPGAYPNTTHPSAQVYPHSYPSYSYGYPTNPYSYPYTHTSSDPNRKFVNNTIYLNGLPPDTPPYEKDTSRQRELDFIDELPESLFEWRVAPKINGLTLSGTVGVKLNLHAIGRHLRNCEFRPSELVAVRVQLSNPQITASIFSTGTINIAGVKSLVTGIIGLRKVAQKLRRQCELHEINVVQNIRIGSVSGSASMPKHLNLRSIELAYPKKADYDTELNNGFLIFRDPIIHPKGNAQIHGNGSINILGCGGVHELYEWFEQLYLICKDHYIQDTVAPSPENQYFNSNGQILSWEQEQQFQQVFQHTGHTPASHNHTNPYGYPPPLGGSSVPHTASNSQSRLPPPPQIGAPAPGHGYSTTHLPRRQSYVQNSRIPRAPPLRPRGSRAYYPPTRGRYGKAPPLLAAPPVRAMKRPPALQRATNGAINGATAKPKVTKASFTVAPPVVAPPIRRNVRRKT